jgi:hypothetical protein
METVQTPFGNVRGRTLLPDYRDNNFDGFGWLAEPGVIDGTRWTLDEQKAFFRPLMELALKKGSVVVPVNLGESVRKKNSAWNQPETHRPRASTFHTDGKWSAPNILGLYCDSTGRNGIPTIIASRLAIAKALCSILDDQHAVDAYIDNMRTLQTSDIPFNPGFSNLYHEIANDVITIVRGLSLPFDEAPLGSPKDQSFSSILYHFRTTNTAYFNEHHHDLPLNVALQRRLAADHESVDIHWGKHTIALISHRPSHALRAAETPVPRSDTPTKLLYSNFMPFTAA